jgi:hypothetical protein
MNQPIETVKNSAQIQSLEGLESQEVQGDKNGQRKKKKEGATHGGAKMTLPELKKQARVQNPQKNSAYLR